MSADCEWAVIWLSHSRVCHIPGDGLHRCPHVPSRVTATVSGYTVVGNLVWAVSSPQLSLALFSLKLPHLICAAGGVFKLTQIFKTGFLRAWLKWLIFYQTQTVCVCVHVKMKVKQNKQKKSGCIKASKEGFRETERYSKDTAFLLLINSCISLY